MSTASTHATSDRDRAARTAARTKRLLDIAFSATALAATAPLQGLVALTVAATLGRPVLFRQLRPGLHAEHFTLVKFRTMHAPTPGRVTDADRLTRLGRLLRATSLDELPTLWNVLRGDMSLVGPRPLLPEYLDRYTARQARRHDVRPGITGLAQVSGRNALDWDSRLELDVAYVDSWTLRSDLVILARTVVRVLRRDGVTAPGEATVAEFTGIPSLRGPHAA
ncbi:sugar transferase [Georgenia yuyongxinii]